MNMAQVKKSTFIARQRRKGRTQKQAESDWKASNRMRRMRNEKKPKRKPAARKTTPKKKTAARKKTTARTKRKSTGGMSSYFNPDSVPVLLMNEGKAGSTVKRKRRRKTTPKKRRRTRRKKNPSYPIGGVAQAGIGGAVVGGGTFLLDGTDLSMPAQYGIVGAGAGLGGAVLANWLPSLGMGLVAGGFAVAGLGFLRHYLTPPFGEKAVQTEKEGSAAAMQGVQARNAMLSAVRSRLGCSRSSCRGCSRWHECEMSRYYGRRKTPAMAAAAPSMGAVSAPLPARSMSAVRAPMPGSHIAWPGYNMAAVAQTLAGNNPHKR